MKLVDDVQSLLAASPDVAAFLNLDTFEDFADMAGTLFATLCNSQVVGAKVRETYARHPELVDITCYDIAETARRNFEPGGAPATFLFSRGAQSIMGHRVAHQIWSEGDTNLSLALNSTLGRAFATDIHPAAQIGAGLWLDHGLGFVVGETSVIEEDVSIWHNVTLGSTLNDAGPRRHPLICKGAVIGAGAILLGDIKVGAGANIAAGAIVVEDVPSGVLIAGSKATRRGTAKVNFK